MRLHVAYWRIDITGTAKPGRVDMTVEHPPFDGDDVEEIEQRIAASYDLSQQDIIVMSWQAFDEPLAADEAQPEAVDQWLGS